jgi:hypothetical protein
MVKSIRKVLAGIALLSVELIIVLVLFFASLLTLAFVINDIFELKNYTFDMKMFDYVRSFI